MTPTDSAEPSDSPTERLHVALKRSASALKAGAVPFALAGSYALWVHGAPESTHDVDLAVAESSVEDAARCLSEDGFTIERPPEDWLFKAHLDGAMVDVLHRVNGVPVTPDYLDQVTPVDVLGVRIPVLAPTEVVSANLRTLSERYCDFGKLLPPIRAVREQLDWSRLDRDCTDSPYARAFLFLAGELGIAPADPATD